MVTTIHYCAKCTSDQLRRNGSKQGQPKYQCKACGYQGLFVPAAVRKTAQYAQVDALLLERNSQRSIARVTGVARMTIAKRIKKSGSAATATTPLAPQKGAKKAVGGTGIG
ncbi:IS1 family transposase [Hymenobacter sp. UV11]|uniref:IS1 family transposase n=1 Tax=Hymenobacter sp. UV11 TaxID=1849735 RepID=UPI001061B5DE|nr:IS1 family transposase [Hymenobacter sp. UV11]